MLFYQKISYQVYIKTLSFLTCQSMLNTIFPHRIDLDPNHSFDPNLTSKLIFLKKVLNISNIYRMINHKIMMNK